MIPVAIVGFFFKDKVEEIFGSGLLLVGIMLIVTALLLAFAYFAKPRQREHISGLHAFIIGIGQAIAVMPGHCHGTAVGQQKRESGPIFLPYGNSSCIG